MLRSALCSTLVAAGLAGACAHYATAREDPRPVAATHDRSVLTRDDLRASSDQYLYDLVQRLRPEWLYTHGSTSIGGGVGGNVDPDPVRVYVGMVRLGGPEVLTRLPTAQADSLKYFTPAQAQQRFGPGHLNGAIQVLSAPPPPAP